MCERGENNMTTLTMYSSQFQGGGGKTRMIELEEVGTGSKKGHVTEKERCVAHNKHSTFLSSTHHKNWKDYAIFSRWIRRNSNCKETFSRGVP